MRFWCAVTKNFITFKEGTVYIQVRDVTCVCSRSSLSFPSSPPHRTAVLYALFKFNIEMTEYDSGKAQRELAAILTPLPTLAGCYQASEKALKGLETQFKVAQWEVFFFFSSLKSVTTEIFGAREGGVCEDGGRVRGGGACLNMPWLETIVNEKENEGQRHLLPVYIRDTLFLFISAQKIGIYQEFRHWGTADFTRTMKCCLKPYCYH